MTEAPLDITILGCGSSGGVPRVGMGWGACDPANPRNRRRRCSILVERRGQDGTTSVLVDTSPDLREQLIDAQVNRLDGILITHDHADHTHGLDDVRSLVIHMRRRIRLHADERTSAVLNERFGYIFRTPTGSLYPPLLDECRLEVGSPFSIDGPGGPLTGVPFDMEHGETRALGFRFGRFAYASDVSALPPESLEMLRGLDLLIVDALRYTSHPSHFSVADALATIADLKPVRAVLTNLHTDLDYAKLAAELPAGVEPAFDGMRLTA